MERKITKKKRKLFYYLIIGIIAIGTILFFSSFKEKLESSSYYFRIKKVEIKGNIEKELKRKIIYLVKDKSIFLDLSSLRKKILVQEPSIKEIKMLKIFPSQLVIEIIKANPFLQIEDKNIYVIDEEGKVIQIINKPLLKIPLLKVGRFKKTPRLGEVLTDEKIKKAISFYKFLKEKSRFSPQIILAYHPSTLAFIQEGTKIILGAGKWEEKLRILDALLKDRFKNRLGDFQYIDLREEKIYIRKR